MKRGKDTADRGSDIANTADIDAYKELEDESK